MFSSTDTYPEGDFLSDRGNPGSVADNYGRQPYPFETPAQKPQRMSIEKFLQGIEGDTQKITMLQYSLMNAGKLTGSFRKGYIDEPTMDAFAEAAFEANANGATIGEWLALSKAQMRGAAEDYEGAYSGQLDGDGYDGPQTYTSEAIRYNYTSRGQARAILTSALAKELGREPSGQEVTAFLNGLHAKQKDDPTVTTTTTTVDKNDRTSTTTTEPSDVDPVGFAERTAEKQNPREASRYQGGNYYNIIANMLGV